MIFLTIGRSLATLLSASYPRRRKIAARPFVCSHPTMTLELNEFAYSSSAISQIYARIRLADLAFFARAQMLTRLARLHPAPLTRLSLIIHMMYRRSNRRLLTTLHLFLGANGGAPSSSLQRSLIADRWNGPGTLKSSIIISRSPSDRRARDQVDLPNEASSKHHDQSFINGGLKIPAKSRISRTRYTSQIDSPSSCERESVRRIQFFGFSEIASVTKAEW